MPDYKKNKIYQCYFELALDLISGKWKMLILYYISKEKFIRYSRLKTLIPKINERMLTKRLRELERDKIIIRKVYNQIPPKVEYSLSELGKSILLIVNQLEVLGEEYYKKVDKERVIVEYHEDYDNG